MFDLTIKINIKLKFEIDYSVIKTKENVQNYKMQFVA